MIASPNRWAAALAVPLALAACTTPRPSTAPRSIAEPSPDEQAVVATAVRLFDAMATRDTTALRAVLHPRADLIVVDSTGRVQRIQASGWIRSIGASTEVLHERPSGPSRVEIDGPLATVWMPYTFHIGDQFSHCGIDAMQFARTPGGPWQLLTVAFTMRRANCPR